MTDDSDRIRDLERKHSSLLERVQGIDRQQTAQWSEMHRLEERHTKSLENLRAENKADTEKLMNAITANKLAWKMMDTGTKLVAWIILAVIGLAGSIAAILSAFKRFTG